MGCILPCTQNTTTTSNTHITSQEISQEDKICGIAKDRFPFFAIAAVFGGVLIGATLFNVISPLIGVIGILFLGALNFLTCGGCSQSPSAFSSREEIVTSVAPALVRPIFTGPTVSLHTRYVPTTVSHRRLGGRDRIVPQHASVAPRSTHMQTRTRESYPSSHASVGTFRDNR